MRSKPTFISPLAVGNSATESTFLMHAPSGVVLSFAGSTLKTPSLFYTDRFVPSYSLVQFVVAAALFYVAVFVLFKRRPDRSTRKMF